MRSLERALNGWGAALPGAAPLQLLGMALLLGLQTVEIGGSSQLLQFRGAWALQPLCVAMLAAVIGLRGAVLRKDRPLRPFLLDALRLFGPVYAVAVVAALLGGSMVSDRSVIDYASDPETASYALNLLGWPHYFLPGVFEFNDVSGLVNRNVWIVPFLLAGTLAVAPLRARWRLHLAPAVLVLAIILAALIAEALGVESGGRLGLTAIALQGDGLSAMTGGLVAVALYRVRRHVPAALGWTLACMGALLVQIVVGHDGWEMSAVFRITSGAAVAYLTVVASAQPLPIARPARRIADYLPGLFLFSFPLQQALVQLAPVVRRPMADAAAGLAAAAIAAVASWHLFGRRLLSERQRQPQIAEIRRGAAGPRRSMFRSRSDAAMQIALASLFIAAALGFMAMLYLAMLPQQEGS